MRIMVTGATGLTGSHAVRAFLGAGHSVRLLVRDRDKVRRVFDPVGVAIAESDVIAGDIIDESSVAAAMAGCDAVFHSAALVEMKRSESQRVLDTNARGVELVIGGAAKRGLPSIVYVSSASVLFQPGLPELHLGMPIATATTAYAQSKIDAEHAVRRLQDEGHPVRISYPSGILGPDDPGLSGGNHALYAFIALMGIITSGTFQAVDARDLAALHTLLVELPDGAHRYVAAGPALPWVEVYDLLDDLVGFRVPRYAIPGAALRGSGIVGDIVKRIWDFEYPLTRDAMEFATQWPGIDGTATTAALGIEWRPPRETYADTIRWMHRAGHVEARKIGKLANG